MYKHEWKGTEDPFFFFLSFFLLFTFENDLNLFWVNHFGKFFGKKLGKGAPISLLAPGARNPRYATGGERQASLKPA